MTTTSWLIGLHALTWHAPACYDDHGRCIAYRKATTGIYARAPSGLTFGGYTNSYGRSSAYAGWTWETADKRFALTAGAVTGYERAALLPLLAPSVRIGLSGSTALRIAAIPRHGQQGAAILHLSIEALAALPP